jgi:hypothetical protein
MVSSLSYFPCAILKHFSLQPGCLGLQAHPLSRPLMQPPCRLWAAKLAANPFACAEAAQARAASAACSAAQSQVAISLPSLAKKGRPPLCLFLLALGLLPRPPGPLPWSVHAPRDPAPSSSPASLAPPAAVGWDGEPLPLPPAPGPGSTFPLWDRGSSRRRRWPAPSFLFGGGGLSL